jgi:N-acetylglucosaminyldiphosphoundecaprenol N-acetyl-beta-D-mannosaminyltransferase
MSIVHSRRDETPRSGSDDTTGRVYLKGLPIDCVSEEGAVDRILTRLRAGYGGWVATPNVDHFRALSARPELMALVSSANLIVADGMPLVWASKLQGTPLPGRVCGSALLLSLTAAATLAGVSIFLLGGDPGSAEKAAAVMAQKYRGLKLAGMLCPPLGFEKDESQLASICNELRRARPGIVYCCFGFPKQELVIQRLRDSLPTSWFLGVGGSLSMVSGEISRAPTWMQQAGLEWVWRLLKEPRRLAARYLAHDLPFAIWLLWSSRPRRFARRRVRSSPRRQIALRTQDANVVSE